MKFDKPEDENPDHFRKYVERWEGLVVETVSSPGQSIAKLWLEAFKRLPFWTSAITLIVSLGLGVIAYLSQKDVQERASQKKLENLSLNNQLTNLNKTEQNLQDLLKFIDVQRTQLHESEQIIKGLESEKKNLEPLVNADRGVVEAIFSAHEERQRNSIWKERSFGFGFGVLASLIATAIWSIVGAFLSRSRRVETEEA